MPKEVRAELLKLHRQLNHPTAAALQRLLRRAGARLGVIEAASDLPCGACDDALRRKHPDSSYSS